jgi:multicomponent Na+:H+ antiporter subunit G
MIEVLTATMWVAGAAFAMLAAVGLLRMPDVFTRMQASTKASTLGLGCLLLGAALQLGDFASFIRVISIGAFVLLTTPVAAHVIARAAYLANIPLWEGTVLDERRHELDRVAQEEQRQRERGSARGDEPGRGRPVPE